MMRKSSPADSEAGRYLIEVISRYRAISTSGRLLNLPLFIGYNFLSRRFVCTIFTGFGGCYSFGLDRDDEHIDNHTGKVRILAGAMARIVHCC